MFEALNRLPPRPSRPPAAPVVEIADQSVRLARIAQDLIGIARQLEDPQVVEALGRSIGEILETSNALSSSVLRQAKKII